MISPMQCAITSTTTPTSSYMFSLSPALWFVCARPKPSPWGLVFCFAGQNTCPVWFLYCGLPSPQPASMHHPIHSLYPHHILFCTLDQYWVRGLGFLFCRPKHLPHVISLLWPSITSTSLYAPPHTFSLPPTHLVLHPRLILSVWTQFLILQAKTTPMHDLAILASHHLMYLTPHVIIALSTSYTNPPPMLRGLCTILAFGDQNHLPLMISCSLHCTTSIISVASPPMSPGLPPQV